MAKKRAGKSKRHMGDFSLLGLHAAFEITRKRLKKKKPDTPAKAALMQDLNNAQALVKCDQGMYRQIAPPKT